MKTLILSEIVNETVSNTEGCKLFYVIKSEINNNKKVILKVDNDHILSTSFLNSSIGEFLEEFGMQFFKEKIIFKGSKLQFQRIKKYLDRFEKVHLA